MKVRGRDGGLWLRLDAPEAQTLEALMNDLVHALEPRALDVDDPVYRRLFPDGYQDDPVAAQQFRELTESGLRSERVERVAECLAELSAATAAGRKAEMVLSAEAAQRWIQVLNDLRLAIGTRLNVTEGDADRALSPKDPQAMTWAVYGYLTAVQDTVVQALMP